jgi:hypothetical protein
LIEPVFAGVGGRNEMIEIHAKASYHISRP